MPGNFLGFLIHKKGIEVNENKAKVIIGAKPTTNKKELQIFFGKVNYLRRFISNLSGKTRVFTRLIKLEKEEDFFWTTEHQEAFNQIKKYLPFPLIMAPPRHGKPVKLYISASETTIGSMLVQDDDYGVERVVY